MTSGGGFGGEADVLYVSVRAQTDEASFREMERAAADAGENAGEGAGAGLKGKMGAALAGLPGLALAAGAAVGTALASGMRSALDIAQQVNQGQRDMQASLGVTAEEAEKLGEVAKRVFGNNWGADLKAAQDAVANVRREIEGLSEDDLQGVAEGSVAIAERFQEDQAKVAAAVRSLMKATEMSAQESLDFIAAGFQRGLNSSGDFLDTLNEYGPQFEKARISGDQLFSLLETGAAKGALGTDKVADAFKEMGLTIVEVTDDSKAIYAELGIDQQKLVDDLNKGAMTQTQAFQLITDKLKGVQGEANRTRIASAIFGGAGEDFGPGLTQLDLTKTKLTDLQGSTQQVKDATNTLSSVFETAWRQVQLQMEPVGQELLKLAQQVMPDIERAIQQIGPAVTGVVRLMVDGFRNADVIAEQLRATLVAVGLALLVVQRQAIATAAASTWAGLTAAVATIGSVTAATQALTVALGGIPGILAIVTAGFALWANSVISEIERVQNAIAEADRQSTNDLMAQVKALREAGDAYSLAKAKFLLANDALLKAQQGTPQVGFFGEITYKPDPAAVAQAQKNLDAAKLALEAARKQAPTGGTGTTPGAASADQFGYEFISSLKDVFVNDPKVDSDCAVIASAILQKLGIKIQGSANAGVLEQNALKAGFQRVEGDEIKPGDLIVWTTGNGKTYGLNSGKHVGVAAGFKNGQLMVINNPGSSNTVVEPMFDRQNAVAYRAPNSPYAGGTPVTVPLAGAGEETDLQKEQRLRAEQVATEKLTVAIRNASKARLEAIITAGVQEEGDLQRITLAEKELERRGQLSEQAAAQAKAARDRDAKDAERDAEVAAQNRARTQQALQTALAKGNEQAATTQLNALKRQQATELDAARNSAVKRAEIIEKTGPAILAAEQKIINLKRDLAVKEAQRVADEAKKLPGADLAAIERTRRETVRQAYAQAAQDRQDAADKQAEIQRNANRAALADQQQHARESLDAQRKANAAQAQLDQQAYRDQRDSQLASIQNLSKDGLNRLYDQAVATRDQVLLTAFYDEVDRRARESKKEADALWDSLVQAAKAAGIDPEDRTDPNIGRGSGPDKVGLRGLIGNIGDFVNLALSGEFQDLPENILSQFTPGDFAALGDDVLQGLLDGLSGAPGWEKVTALIRSELDLKQDVVSLVTDAAAATGNGFRTGNERPDGDGTVAPGSLAAMVANQQALDEYAATLKALTPEQLKAAAAVAIAQDNQAAYNLVLAEGKRRVDEAKDAEVKLAAARQAWMDNMARIDFEDWTRTLKDYDAAQLDSAETVAIATGNIAQYNAVQAERARRVTEAAAAEKLLADAQAANLKSWEDNMARLGFEDWTQNLRDFDEAQLDSAITTAVLNENVAEYNALMAERARRTKDAAEAEAKLVNVTNLKAKFAEGRTKGDESGAASILGVASAFGSLLSPLNLFGQILERINPVGMVLEGIFSVLAEPIKAIQEPLKTIGTLIGSVLAPILKIFAPILKAVVDVIVAIYDVLAAVLKTVTFGLVDISRQPVSTGVTTPTSPSVATGAGVSTASTPAITFRVEMHNTFHIGESIDSPATHQRLANTMQGVLHQGLSELGLIKLPAVIPTR